MEFASIFNGLGVAVTVLYRGDQILRDFDMELRDGLAEAMRNRGVDLRMNADIASIEQEGRGYRVHLKRGDSVAADLVMAATGRVPNTSGLGLQQVGVELGWNGHVVVDEFSKSSVDNIYAVGDVTDRVQPDAGRDSRSDRLRRDAVQRQADAGGSYLHPDRGVFAAGDRHGRAHRRRRRARCIAASISTRPGSGRSRPRSAAATRRC